MCIKMRILLLLAFQAFSWLNLCLFSSSICSCILCCLCSSLCLSSANSDSTLLSTSSFSSFNCSKVGSVLPKNHHYFSELGEFKEILTSFFSLHLRMLSFFFSFIDKYVWYHSSCSLISSSVLVGMAIKACLINIIFPYKCTKVNSIECR